MKKNPLMSLLLYITVFELFFCLVESTNNPWNSAPAQAQEYSSNSLFSPEQLDNLLAPIALYPDPLLAQVLIAATYVDQVDEAARWVRAYDNPEEIDDQPWDVSVKAVAHYPPVLQMMSDQIDWTTSVGQAYVDQPADLMMSVQRLRLQAYELGHLITNEQQEVIVEGNEIRIVPFQSEVIYVPMYDPNFIYLQSGADFGDNYPTDLITFGAGFTIGVWLIHDFDWHDHRIYYHGWEGRGWIAHSRPHVRITDAGYVNNHHRTIQINRNVVHRNVNYRNLNRYSSLHPDLTYDNLERRTQRNLPGNTNAGNKVIRRNVDVNDPKMDTFRGHRRKQQTVEQANQPPLQPPALQRTVPLPKEENRTPEFHTRPEPKSVPIPKREPAQFGRPPLPQSSSEVQRNSFSVFGGSRNGLDPQAITRRGESSRSLANQPASRPLLKAPNTPANRSGGRAPERRP